MLIFYDRGSPRHADTAVRLGSGSLDLIGDHDGALDVLEQNAGLLSGARVCCLLKQCLGSAGDGVPAPYDSDSFFWCWRGMLVLSAKENHLPAMVDPHIGMLSFQQAL